MHKIIVRTIRGTERFRRAGLEFTRDPVEIDADALDDDVLASLQTEPRLAIVDAGPADDEPPKNSGTAKAKKKPNAD